MVNKNVLKNLQFGLFEIFKFSFYKPKKPSFLKRTSTALAEVTV